MNDSLHAESVKVADRFIKSILFVDDQIKWEDEIDQHDLNALSLTKTFAKKGKACSFFNFKNQGEDDDIIKILMNCDVAVIDWRIDINNDIPDPKEEEEDVDVQEGRGRYTIQLLKKIFESKVHSPKIIIVLTGENNGNAIFNELKKNFNNFEADENHLTLSNKVFRLSIYFKPTLKEAKLSENVEYKVIHYDQLPDIISMEFATLSSGFLSNVTLDSISALRENTNKLLQEYSKDLDIAYLAHRAMCPIPEDAEQSILDSLIGSINSILTYENSNQYCDIKRINFWMESKEFKPQEISIGKKVNKISIDKELIKEWLEIGYKNCFQKKLDDQGVFLTTKQLENYDRNNLLKDVLKIFPSVNNSNEEFAILTHHKSNFYHEGYSPKLTLGTVVKARNNDEYYLCIQQRCDSIRIAENCPRSFIFLPLEQPENDKDFSIIFKSHGGEYIKLKEKNNCFDLKTIVFPQTEKGMVTAINKNFIDSKGDEYEWLLDLKDSHAQKIVNEFAAKLSRVGVDESEWLRRS